LRVRTPIILNSRLESFVLELNRRSVIAQGVTFAAMAGAVKAKAAMPKVEALYRRSIVLDTLSMELSTFDPRPAMDAGLTGVVLDLLAYPRTAETAVRELDKWNAAISAPGSAFYRILKAADFAEAKRLGKFGILLDSQDASILGTSMFANSPENMETLQMLFGKGLRVLQLTYTTSNALGAGYADVYDAGLTRLGRAVVDEMNRLGMLIDISHCSEKTTLEAVERSNRPIAATHSGCFSLYADKRNKSDTVIRAIADKGGYMGIYNMTLWMTRDPTSSVETIADHIDHAVKVGGIDLVGFGSDHAVAGEKRTQAEQVALMSEFVARNKAWTGGEPMHGHATATDLDGLDRLLVLANALDRRGYGDDAIEKVLGANFVRVFGAACG
jgi:membrane dipeptidase